MKPGATAGETKSQAMAIEARGLCCGYGTTRVVDDVSFSVGKGEILCLLGPNGVGKTTLFKTMLGFIPPQGGRLLIQGEETSEWSRKRFARSVGYVPQNHTPTFPFSVHEVVLMGRTPLLGTFSTVTSADEEIVCRFMEQLGILPLAERDYTTLSGGERQKVLICRALVQEPAVLVMDEPTSNLDFGNRMLVLECIRSLAAAGLSVIMTTHDPNQVFQLNSTVALMGAGGAFERGPAETVITPANLEALYAIQVCVAKAFSPDGAELTACIPYTRSPGVNGSEK